MKNTQTPISSSMGNQDTKMLISSDCSSRGLPDTCTPYFSRSETIQRSPGEVSVGATGVRGDVQHVAARTALHVHLADASRLGVVHELRVGHAVLGLGASVKLLEDGEQHKGYHHPDSDFRK